MNKNGYTSVTSWRDDVSKSLGGIEQNITNIDNKLGQVCKKIEKHEDRIDTLEEVESNRKAVQKRLNALWASIIVFVSAAANIAFKVFN